MLPKKQRINKKLFEKIFKEGKNYHSDFLGAKISRTKTENSQFAFTVSKKIAPTAVQRNLLRRRGYSIVQKYLPKIKTPIIGIFILKKGSNKLNTDEYKKEIEIILNKANLL